MSFNPLLARASATDKTLFPLPKPNERLILTRKGVSLSLKCDEAYSGKGRLFLSNLRLVFLKEGDVEKHKKFSSVELPLRFIHGKERSKPPEFKQPVFGANALVGNCLPTKNAEYPFPQSGEFSLGFTEGGCQAFLKAFFHFYEPARRNSELPFNTAAGTVNTMFQGNAAFVDPSDPSVIYAMQPNPDQAYCWNGAHGEYMPMPCVPGQQSPTGVGAQSIGGQQMMQTMPQQMQQMPQQMQTIPQQMQQMQPGMQPAMYIAVPGMPPPGMVPPMGMAMQPVGMVPIQAMPMGMYMQPGMGMAPGMQLQPGMQMQPCGLAVPGMGSPQRVGSPQASYLPNDASHLSMAATSATAATSQNKSRPPQESKSVDENISLTDEQPGVSGTHSPAAANPTLVVTADDESHMGPNYSLHGPTENTNEQLKTMLASERRRNKDLKDRIVILDAAVKRNEAFNTNSPK